MQLNSKHSKCQLGNGSVKFRKPNAQKAQVQPKKAVQCAVYKLTGRICKTMGRKPAAGISTTSRFIAHPLPDPPSNHRAAAAAAAVGVALRHLRHGTAGTRVSPHKKKRCHFRSTALIAAVKDTYRSTGQGTRQGSEAQNARSTQRWQPQPQPQPCALQQPFG